MRALRRIPAWAVVLGLVMLAGTALRVEHALDHGRFLSTDERAYTKLAVGLETTGRYAAPNMRDPLHWPPGTPALFAVARQLGGAADPSVLAPDSIYWAQAVVGVLLILVAFALARILAGPWAGVVAAGAVALYPPLSTITGDAVSEPLGALTLALAMLCLAWAWRGEERGVRHPWRWWATGALLGGCVLVRADLLVVPFLFAGPIAAVLWRRRGARWAVGTAAGFVAAAVLVLAPWAGYATGLRDGQFTPVTTSSWSSLFVATYLPGQGSMNGLKRELGAEARRHNARLRAIPDNRLRATWILDAVAARHPDLGRSKALQRETYENLRRYALGDPPAFGALQARKIARMWLGYDRGTHHARRAWILVVHLTLAALGLLGLLGGLARTRHPVLGALLLAVVAGTVVNAFFVSEARHNVRLMPLLLAGGAAGAMLAVRARARTGASAPTVSAGTAAGRAPAGRTGPPRAGTDGRPGPSGAPASDAAGAG